MDAGDRAWKQRQSRHETAWPQEMTLANRTTQITVTFNSPFRLPGFDVAQPAGEYRVEWDDEAIEGPSVTAYRRVATFIHLPAISARSLTRHMVPVDRADLEQAILNDKETK